MMATYSGALEEILLAKGAQINARNADGVTVLMLLAQHGNAEILKEALDVGADPTLQDNAGHTALDYLLASSCQKPLIPSKAMDADRSQRTPSMPANKPGVSQEPDAAENSDAKTAIALAKKSYGGKKTDLLLSLASTRPLSRHRIDLHDPLLYRHLRISLCNPRAQRIESVLYPADTGAHSVSARAVTGLPSLLMTMLPLRYCTWFKTSPKL
jgi:hypothetical protein